jgi:hypothetical protein
MPQTIALSEYYWNGPTLLEDAEPGTRIACKAVAVVGHRGEHRDWAAYWGPTDQTDSEVAHMGDKINRAAAEALFPTFRDLGFIYRP